MEGLGHLWALRKKDVITVFCKFDMSTFSGVAKGIQVDSPSASLYRCKVLGI
jgi:hypothetical protein